MSVTITLKSNRREKKMTDILFDLTYFFNNLKGQDLHAMYSQFCLWCAFELCHHLCMGKIYILFKAFLLNEVSVILT